MREKLYIRFLEDEHSAIEWLVKDVGGQEANSGFLDNVSRLSELQETAQGKQVIVIIPGSECLTSWLEIPKKQARQLLKAIPFMMEEKLAQDIEQMHFAIGRRDGTKLEVMAIADQRLQSYRKTLNKYDFHIDAMYADTAALTVNDNQVFIDQYSFIANIKGNVYRFNQDEWQDVLPLLLDELEQDSELSAYLAEADYESFLYPDKVESDSDAAEQEPPKYSVKVELVRHGLSHLTQQLATQLNLLQGKYDEKETWVTHAKKWRIPAALAAAWLLVSLASSFIQVWQLQQQKDGLKEQVRAAYQSVFPNETRLIRPRSQMQKKLDALGAGEGEAAFLKLLDQVSKGFSGKLDVKPTYMSYNSRTQEIRIDLDGKDIQTLTELKNQLSSAEYSVDLSSMTAKKERYSARLVVKVNS